MRADRFIASKLAFRGKMAVASAAISFLVMIIAVSVSAGFRKEIRRGIASVSGDVCLQESSSDIYSGTNPMCLDSLLSSSIEALDGIEGITPVVYRAGIIKNGNRIQGVLLKGEASSSDSLSMQVCIPSRLARMMSLKVGDPMLTYFVGDKVKARRFTVSQIFDTPVQTDAAIIVKAGLEDLQRLNGWDDDQVSAMEIRVSYALRSPEKLKQKAAQIGAVAYPLLAQSSVERYSQLYDWLALIDGNVIAVLLLMTLVAAFNMVSGLLIMLFRSISTIGMLKSMGMTNSGISRVFLALSARSLALGMLIGNALALSFCALQGMTHLIKLNPENYFVSFVPVSVNLPHILLADAVSFVVILLLLLIPCRFISKIDPADSVRVK